MDEVDFLDVVGVDENSVTISFLVHNEEELGVVESRHHMERMEISTNLTDDLHYQLSYNDGNNHHHSFLNGFYETIPGFSCYKSLQGTFDWMNDMVIRARFIPHLSVTMTDIGDSFLKTQDQNTGHDMLALKITGTATGSVNKGVFFAMSGIHAREYAPPELLSRWAESLMDAYHTDADITAMLDHTEIHLVFQSNPDGRQVAESNRTLYRRKNLNPNGDDGIAPCEEGTYGVDLNRNFPFRWGEGVGSSGNKCSQVYRGTSPASESEVQAIVNYCESVFPIDQRKTDPEAQAQEGYDEATTRGVFLDVHAFGELIVWPWVST